MSDKFLYENARVKSLEPKMVSVAQMQRLAECGSVAEAFKLLVEFGLGSGVPFEGNDFDKLFKVEEDNLASLMRELNTTTHAMDAVLLQNDYHNLKTLVKAHLANDTPDALTGEGIFDVDTLQEGVTGERYSLRPNMIAALENVDKQVIEGKVNPREIDIAFDKAMFADVLNVSKNVKLLHDYYVQTIDYANILTFLRCKKLGLDLGAFTDAFIEGATLPIETFTGAFEGGVDALKGALTYTPFKSATENFANGASSFVTFEVERDNALLNVFRHEKNDMFSAAPILGYYFGRQTELKTMKLIVAGIKNHVAPALIRERMRDIYA